MYSEIICTVKFTYLRERSFKVKKKQIPEIPSFSAVGGIVIRRLGIGLDTSKIEPSCIDLPLFPLALIHQLPWPSNILLCSVWISQREADLEDILTPSNAGPSLLGGGCGAASAGASSRASLKSMDRPPLDQLMIVSFSLCQVCFSLDYRMMILSEFGGYQILQTSRAPPFVQRLVWYQSPRTPLLDVLPLVCSFSTAFRCQILSLPFPGHFPSISTRTPSSVCDLSRANLVWTMPTCWSSNWRPLVCLDSSMSIHCNFCHKDLTCLPIAWTAESLGCRKHSIFLSP